MRKKIKESDWRAFRDSLVPWRERYLAALNQELGALLAQEQGDASPTERFWQAKERMDEEAAMLRRCLDGYTRSTVRERLVLMYAHGVIDKADLSRFSDALRRHVVEWCDGTG